jgi:hypothetical protein
VTQRRLFSVVLHVRPMVGYSLVPWIELFQVRTSEIPSAHLSTAD